MMILRSCVQRMPPLKKNQAMTISVAQQVKTEPCRTLLANDLDVKRITDNNIKRLLKSLQLERDLDKISLNASKVAAQAFEQYMEEACSGLQHMDEVIHQKILKLKHLEETVEEYYNMMKELQLTNQELKKQLEEAQDEAIFNALNDRMEKEEGLLSSPLSFAEEMKLLASSLEVETSMSDAIYVRHVETNDQELLKHESFTIDLQKKWCAGILETSLHRAVLFVFCIFIFTVLAFVALVATARNYDFFSLNTLWNIAHLMFQRYCNVHYGALPPV
ncbi:uncharacterized protein [Channa argus]|uniref:uncharacterized protein isoform X5 n=1 Tax=Channa argus TaxID=215402 RepID=UPI0035207512